MNTRRDLVAQWVDKADEDFELAAHTLASAPRFRLGIAFHCQQAAEKYLKALLVRHQIEFDKTHAIGRILDLVETVYPGMAASLRAADTLTPFAAQTRYPGDLPECLPGEEREMLELARRVRDAVMPVLAPYLAEA